MTVVYVESTAVKATATWNGYWGKKTMQLLLVHLIMNFALAPKLG